MQTRAVKRVSRRGLVLSAVTTTTTSETDPRGRTDHSMLNAPATVSPVALPSHAIGNNDSRTVRPRVAAEPYRAPSPINRIRLAAAELRANAPTVKMVIETITSMIVSPCLPKFGCTAILPVRQPPQRMGARHGRRHRKDARIGLFFRGKTTKCTSLRPLLPRGRLPAQCHRRGHKSGRWRCGWKRQPNLRASHPVA